MEFADKSTVSTNFKWLNTSDEIWNKLTPFEVPSNFISALIF